MTFMVVGLAVALFPGFQDGVSQSRGAQWLDKWGGFEVRFYGRCVFVV